MTIKQILTFDVNRILRFDVNRILRWDVGRALQRPIPAIFLKILAAWVVAGLLMGILVPVAARRGWHMSEWTPLVVIIATMAIFCASDLVRIVRGNRSAP